MKSVIDKFKKLPFLFISMLLLSSTLWAQQGTLIKGIILDENGDPVIGANIVLKKNKTLGTIADLDGHFQLRVPKPGADDVLVVSYVGMVTQEVKVEKNKLLKIIMYSDSEQLDEVIVVGFGQQKKASVVGAIAQTTGKVLERTGGVTDLGMALTGNIPGLITTQSTGMPGEETPNILIRAQTSWNSSDPLVLVDGIERPLKDVDTNSVETISVLKDASATAVFGVRGANGVILITTKRGEEGKASIDIGANVTMKTVSRLPNKYDTYDALMLKNEVVEYELGFDPSVWGYVNPQSYIENFRNQTTQEQRERYPNIDWQDYLFKDFAMSYDFNINVRGGSKIVKYFVAADYTHEGDLFKEFENGKGFSPKFAYDRLNTRTNFDFQLSKSTLFKVNLFGSYGVSTSPGGAGVGDVGKYMAGAYNTPPDIFYPQYSDGSYGFYYPETNVATNSQMALSDNGVMKRTDTRFSTDFVLEQNLDFILKGLKFQAALSWDNRFREKGRGIEGSGGTRLKWIDPKTGIEYGDPNQGIDTNTGFDWVPSISWTTEGGEMDNGYTYRNLNYNARLDYAATFARNHNVSVMGNFMRQQNASGSNIPTYREDWVFRTTYNYANRYFFEYNGAYNGSEKFSKENRFAFFSSGALGWMLSEERFMKKIKFLDMLKLRFSYGKIGDDNVSERWIYMDEWGYGGNAKMGVLGGAGQTSPYTWYKQKKIGNPDIHWETVTKNNYGVDFAFLDGLIAGSVDVFRDVRKDIIITGKDRANPSYFGASAPTANLGKVEGKGYELELRLNKVFKNQLRVWANLNMTHAVNKILEADDPELLPAYQKKAGYANGQATSYITNGYYNTMDQLYGSTPFKDSDNKIPGNYYIVDYDGDGVIDEDKVPYGYSGNPQNTYNATLGVEWKGFSAFVQFYGVNNVTRNVTLTSFNRPFLNVAYDQGSYWSKEDTEADNPLPRLVSNINGNYLGDRYMYDGSYIRLKNAEIAYTFNDGWIRKVGLRSLRIYLNGNNLWMWSRLPDDRESSMSGGVYVNTAYPTTRRFNLGLKVTL